MTSQLTEIFGLKSSTRGTEAAAFITRTALVIIDVQRSFADPGYRPQFPPGEKTLGNHATERLALRIAGLKEQFVALGVRGCVVHYLEPDLDFERSGAGAHRVRVLPSDIRLGKTECSAFSSFQNVAALRRAGIQNLIMSGLYANECVPASRASALSERFNVCLLSDCIEANHPQDDVRAGMKADALRQMSKQGCASSMIAESDDVLAFFQELRAPESVAA